MAQEVPPDTAEVSRAWALEIGGCNDRNQMNHDISNWLSINTLIVTRSAAKISKISPVRVATFEVGIKDTGARTAVITGQSTMSRVGG